MYSAGVRLKSKSACQPPTSQNSEPSVANNIIYMDVQPTTDSCAYINEDFNEYVAELCRIGDEIHALHFDDEEIHLNRKNNKGNRSHDNSQVIFPITLFGLLCLLIFWKI